MDLSEYMFVASALVRNMIDIHVVFGLPCCATELSTLIGGVGTIRGKYIFLVCVC